MPQFVAVVEQSMKFCWQAANPTSENYIWKKKKKVLKIKVLLSHVQSPLSVC